MVPLIERVAIVYENLSTSNGRAESLRSINLETIFQFVPDGLEVSEYIEADDPRDPSRIEMSDLLLEKLYNMGVIPTRKSLALCDRLSVSSFCRRRLSTVLVHLKFAEHLKEAVTYVERDTFVLVQRR
ncbi:hypothetical protein GOBAR_DD36170 [Gossypium barbadense]|nr:hypothetical protein GOBAR_DD36170 [Gossypium barbadense]